MIFIRDTLQWHRFFFVGVGVGVVVVFTSKFFTLICASLLYTTLNSFNNNKINWPDYVMCESLSITHKYSTESYITSNEFFQQCMICSSFLFCYVFLVANARWKKMLPLIHLDYNFSSFHFIWLDRIAFIINAIH